MADEQDIEIFSGNDVRLEFTVTDNDTEDLLDLTGALNIQWALAKSARGTAIIEKDFSDGVNIVDAPGGVVEVLIPADDSEPLKGTYYHELRLTNAAGKKVTLAYGAAEIAINLIRD